MDTQFISWGYTLNGSTYFPRLVQDVFQAYSYIRCTYPLASSPGFYGNLTPGFRPNLWIVLDDQLGSRVDQSAKDCEKYKVEDRNLCASDYTNSRMRAMRSEWGVPDSMFMYGMISDAAGYFPRGQEQGGSASSGPTGSSDYGWDFDGSYGDWYAADEIGHSLGRGHPVPNSDDPSTPKTTEGCGHSRSDPNYPYPDAIISGVSGDGFDGGDPGLNSKIQMQVYPGLLWHDFMSYCNNQWISDYTYEGMYQTLINHSNAGALGPQLSGSQLTGDFLSLFGNIFVDSNTATFTVFHRLSSVASIPSLVPGDYTIRLLNQNNTILADYPFTPEKVAEAEGNILSYGQVVDFIPSTVQVQIIRNIDQQVLASHSISTHIPTIDQVQISGVSPVTDTVTLSWQAVDADNDPLTFDIYYSRDGGLSFMPYQMGVATASAPINTILLGGSESALMRVVANDGANTAFADSPLFSMAAKPPQPVITTPASGLTINYGQLVNFSGFAYDLQDGGVAAANLTWSSQAGYLGSGEHLSI